MSWLCDNVWSLASAGAILLVTFALAIGLGILCRSLELRFRKRSDKPRRSVVLQGIFYGLKAPVQFFLWLVGLSVIVELLLHCLPEGVVRSPLSFRHFRELIFVVSLSWFILRARAHMEGLFGAHRLKGRVLVEQTQVEAIGKLVTLAVVILSTIAVLSLFGVDMKALLTIGGLGTVAIGLAGKDVFANFFSGFMIYLTRPFKIGDRITSTDRQLEGFVEHIGWYMTRILTVDKLPIYVPNSTFSTVTIGNYAHMRNRRMQETIGFRYGDIPVLPAVVKEIRALLESHSEIDQSQSIYSSVVGYGDSCVNILVQAVTTSPDWGHFLNVRQGILLKVAEIAAKHGADFAFPTTTLHLPEGKAGFPLEQSDS